MLPFGLQTAGEVGLIFYPYIVVNLSKEVFQGFEQIVLAILVEICSCDWSQPIMFASPHFVFKL